ncbi:tRNA (adenosine(37)-N6)-threonylcarbamoyltransferase complex transferase subunit TsaD [Patescibacteria group bacterium]|nr:tRNA (adenosine(37)-N6)-threonylcarbamoyltransferase complex transferase subunit TsaD [Patescibacteria group bacterium]
MNILGIETSCDDTGVAIVKDGFHIVDSLLSSQDHSITGGVVPDIASRKHMEVLPLFTCEIIRRNKDIKIDKVAVVVNPGLIPSLLVGASFSYGFATGIKVPIINMNHLLSHIYAPQMQNPSIKYPHISLLVSGGHTQIVKVLSPIKTEIIGTTLDDAAGEAFDKVARMFNLGYPGGPVVSRIAENGDENRINFPRAMDKKNNYNFSFSGLKTSVLYFIKENKDNVSKEDILASFQYAVVDILVRKTIMVARDLHCNTITISGGVAANKRLREEFLKYNDFEYYFPTIDLCSDNAITVAGLAYHYE